MQQTARGDGVGEKFWADLERFMAADGRVERSMSNAYAISDEHDDLLDQLKQRLRRDYGKRKTGKGRLLEFMIECAYREVFGEDPRG